MNTWPIATWQVSSIWLHIWLTICLLWSQAAVGHLSWHLGRPSPEVGFRAKFLDLMTLSLENVTKWGRGVILPSLIKRLMSLGCPQSDEVKPRGRAGWVAPVCADRNAAPRTWSILHTVFHPLSRHVALDELSAGGRWGWQGWRRMSHWNADACEGLTTGNVGGLFWWIYRQLTDISGLLTFMSWLFRDMFGKSLFGASSRICVGSRMIIKGAFSRPW